MPKALELNKVKITGGVFRERMDIDRRYLAELESAALLQNFHMEAGIPPFNMQTVYDPSEAPLHWGWESPTCQLRGHFLGHWISAAARFWATDGDSVLKNKLDGIIAELERCQKKNGGLWVGPIPEKYFGFMAGEEYIWSPQYTMHKVLMGLIDAYKYADSKQALDIAGRLADWYVDWTDGLQGTDPFVAYKGEQGGMLELWAELLDITGEDKYRTLIDRYKDSGLYHQLSAGKDALTDDHANASIPLSHGAARMYEITGDDYWREVSDRFWKNAVTDRGMFATTGANAGEFWIPPHSQGEYISETDQEFCTVYNMVRTADYLYRRTGDKAYADYIERALYNGFLAQQNMHTGMPTYFLPLRSGSRKKWGSKTRDFWCCHGTMVQAQSLYPQLCYYTEGEDTLLVMQYIPSRTELELGGRRVKLTQQTEMKNYNNQVFFDEQGGGEKSRWSLRFEIECEGGFRLCFRVPEWSRGVSLIVNGEELEPEIGGGLIGLDVAAGKTEIYLMFRSRIVLERLDDMPELAAAVDGPIVLAGLTSRDTGLRGSAEEIFSPRTVHTYSTYVWKQNCCVTRGQRENIEFIPLYDVTDEEYTVYFTVEE